MARKKTVQSSSNMVYSILLVLFPLVAIYFPRLGTLDSNASKFFGLALFNIAVFAFLALRGKLSFNLKENTFFKNLGLVYFLFIVFALLSFVKSVNIGESIIMLAKLVTGFISAILIFKLLNLQKAGLELLIKVMSVLLLLESFYVFYQVGQFINGNLDLLLEISGVYSNKNILSASIFIKIPFAMWLYSYSPKKWKRIGLFGIGFGFLSLLFLSTRSFYLGSIIIFVLFIGLQVGLYFKGRKKGLLRKIVQYFGIFLFTVIVFSLVQHYLYPKDNSDRLNVDLISRLETINTTESTANKRLTYWTHSIDLIKEEPLLGVGIGNWKIRILEWANQKNPGYTYLVKNHNDFLEMYSEIGLIGGSFYLLIFVLVGWYFIDSIRRKSIKAMMLPALGLLSYSIDSFFNFPMDRPEIAIFFSIFIAVALDTEFVQSQGSILDKIKFNKIIEKNTRGFRIGVFIFGLLLTMVAYVLFLNFKSYKEQNVVRAEMLSGKLKKSSKEVIMKFPKIPNINTYGQSISVSKARYLINEKNYGKAISLLKGDKLNPYDGRRELYLYMCYLNINELDSAMFFINKAIEIKPLHYKSTALKCELLAMNNQEDEIISTLKNYIDLSKKNKDAWYRLCQAYQKDNFEKSIEILDSALNFFNRTKDRKEILNYKTNLEKNHLIEPYLDAFNRAVKLYNAGDYVNAEVLFSEILHEENRLLDVFKLRSSCYFSLNQYQLCIDDYNYIEKGEKLSSNMLNKRGAAYFNLGDEINACKDFSLAAQEGNKDGIQNYNTYCK